MKKYVVWAIVTAALALVVLQPATGVNLAHADGGGGPKCKACG